jgi:hypothetical protein
MMPSNWLFRVQVTVSGAPLLVGLDGRHVTAVERGDDAGVVDGARGVAPT